MKNRKMNIRPYTKQFYKGNIVYFIFALCETLLGAIGALLVSWLIQQLIDLIGGYETGFTLLQLTIITLILIAGIAVANLISYYSKPKFITRGISQYKEYVFGELTKKTYLPFPVRILQLIYLRSQMIFKRLSKVTYGIYFQCSTVFLPSSAQWF